LISPSRNTYSSMPVLVAIEQDWKPDASVMGSATMLSQASPAPLEAVEGFASML